MSQKKWTKKYKKNKFDFMYMTDGDTGVVVFNKKLWTQAQAIKQARFELDSIGDESQGEVEIFTSYTSYGYYTNCDDQVENGWSIPDCHTQNLVGIGENYKVPVWVVKIKEVSK